MARTRRTEQDAAIDAEIGRRVAELRVQEQWTLRDLAQRVGLSPTHLNALEIGKHPISAALVIRLAMIFNVPVGKLLGEDIPRGTLAEEWQTSFEMLPTRDQAVLVDLAHKLGNWAKSFSLGTLRRQHRRPGLLVALEGIDGVLLRRLATAVQAELGGVPSVELLSYDHDSELWGLLRTRFRDPMQHPFERTLLFACERLLRQEAALRPALHEDHVVLAPFFAMAPSVYQEVDGSGDRRLIDIIDTLVLAPDILVLVDSSPSLAARGATRDVPDEGSFYSPYTREAEFERARELYRKAEDEFRSCGHAIAKVDLLAVDWRAEPGALAAPARQLAERIRALRDELREN